MHACTTEACFGVLLLRCIRPTSVGYFFAYRECYSICFCIEIAGWSNTLETEEWFSIANKQAVYWMKMGLRYDLSWQIPSYYQLVEKIHNFDMFNSFGSFRSFDFIWTFITHLNFEYTDIVKKYLSCGWKHCGWWLTMLQLPTTRRCNKYCRIAHTVIQNQIHLIFNCFRPKSAWQ